MLATESPGEGAMNPGGRRAARGCWAESESLAAATAGARVAAAASKSERRRPLALLVPAAAAGAGAGSLAIEASAGETKSVSLLPAVSGEVTRTTAAATGAGAGEEGTSALAAGAEAGAPAAGAEGGDIDVSAAMTAASAGPKNNSSTLNFLSSSALPAAAPSEKRRQQKKHARTAIRRVKDDLGIAKNVEKRAGDKDKERVNLPSKIHEGLLVLFRKLSRARGVKKTDAEMGSCWVWDEKSARNGRSRARDNRKRSLFFEFF